MTFRTPLAVALAATALSVIPSTASAASCLTPAAPDEPICNPFAASDWAISHRNSYEQDSSPYAGPRVPADVKLQHLQLDPGTLPFLQFSAKYPDGGRVAWYSEASQPDAIRVGKVDVGSGKLIDKYEVQNAALGSLSGVYTMLDSHQRFIVGKERVLTAYQDAERGVRGSEITVAQRLTLPARALCGSDDRMVGIVPLWTGEIAFATANGAVGVLPGTPDDWTPDAVHAVQLNPAAACADPNAAKEVVANSIASDERGGIYVVTSGAQYRLRWDGENLRTTWRVGYRSDGYQGGVRVAPGSGSSPTIMGTAKKDDKLVVITDGQQVMHMLFMWRDRIPADWKPIAPGADRRLACDVRMDFGDPQIAKAQSEQSVAVRGYGAVVVNNSLKNTAAFDSLPGSLHYTAATLASGDPTNAAHGMERVDWDPKTRTCKVRWVNKEVSIPNAIPVIGAGSDQVYAIGQRNGTWGLEGVDYSTGASKLWIPAGPDPGHNSVYADTELTPDGSVWTGTAGAIDIYRAVKPNAPLKMQCVRPALTHCRRR